MKTDAATWMVVILILLPFALLFALDRWKRARQRQHLLNALHTAARAEGGHLDRHAMSGDVALGLDERQNALYFLHRRQSNGAVQRVELAPMRACQVHIGARGKAPGAPVERVELRFQPKAGQGSGRDLVLFEHGPDRLLHDEAALAIEWGRLINAHLQQR
jgi:hypothetical protein